MKHTICIDVDGTLIFWPGESPGDPGNYLSLFYDNSFSPEINDKLINRLHRWSKSDSSVLILWSARSYEHAVKVARYTDTESYFDLICAKPTAFVDDHFKWLDRINKIDPNKV